MFSYIAGGLWMNPLYRWHQLRKASRAADKWFSGLDRSILGIFAVESAILKAVYVDYHLHKINPKNFHVDVLAADYLEHVINSHLPDVSNRESFYSAKWDAQIEMYFWLYQSNPSIAMNRDMKLNQDGVWTVKEEVFDKLLVVAQYPIQYHPYFAAGLWEPTIVARCVADDIDVEMALELNNV